MSQDYADIFNNRGHDYNAATSRHPRARENERAALLDILQPAADWQNVADAPAGGGYVAEGIRERFGDGLTVTCIEPATKFGAAIPAGFEIRHEALDTVDLPAGTFDGVASLAGLHHFDDKRPVFAEWARLTRAGGRLAVADVGWGTGAAEFLNIFVHEFTPGGHEGIFFEPGEFTTLMMHAGYANVEEFLKPVPWIFSSRESMIDFCRGLFSIEKATPDQVAAALEEFVGVAEEADGSVALKWELVYAAGERR